ncbi:MAG: transcription antitermination factor NusB [Candidatus Amoebophilus sp.]
MIDKPIINRRFVRIKALQNLYAFYINQQANYQNALEQIKLEFIPDVFASTPVSEEQLAQEKSQATLLFNSWISEDKIYLPIQHNYSAVIQDAAKKVWTSYKFNLIQDSKILGNGWGTAIDSIRNTYLLILQLLVEWFQIAQQQSQKASQLRQAGITYPIVLAQSELLGHLQTNNTFLNLTQQYKASWEPHMDVIVRWYNQFIKEAPILTSDTSITDNAGQALIKYLVEDIIFTQEDIQNFFNDIDLSWIEHKPIVKKLLHELLSKSDIELLVKEIEDAMQIGTNAASFYDKLIATALEQEKFIDNLIQQHIKNWSIERTVLLDRIIIKMGLCEMKYFDSIPTKVAINEYVDLAKKYSTAKSSKFINGVLDTIAKTI